MICLNPKFNSVKFYKYIFFYYFSQRACKAVIMSNFYLRNLQSWSLEHKKMLSKNFYELEDQSLLLLISSSIINVI